jgi:hypothetical protein
MSRLFKRVREIIKLKPVEGEMESSQWVNEGELENF